MVLRSLMQIKTIKMLDEAMGSIRDIILVNSKTYLNLYKEWIIG